MIKPPSRLIPLLAVVASVCLSGCASPSPLAGVLQQATDRYRVLAADAEVQRLAPKDIARAKDSLERAQRMDGYWGTDGEVRQYAYLSERYGDIAHQHALLALNQERLAKLDLERQRLQLALRESRLVSVRKQDQWVEEQIMSLSTTDAERGLVLTLGDVLFGSGDAQLQPSANRTMLKLVQYLQANPKRLVRIEGYTDNTGEHAFNQALSQDRAQAVADMLVDLGIAESRLEVQGYGDQYPVEANASERGRALNRRVEIVFSDNQGVLSQGR
jgi:outer membrane protein OmpA-like peptidoglycan-associated protein